MKMFPVDIQIHHVMGFYTTVCAVDGSNYIRKTGSCFKLRFNVGLFNCIVYEFDKPAEMQIILSHSAGMARLRVNWHTPSRLASSLWNAPVA